MALGRKKFPHPCPTLSVVEDTNNMVLGNIDDIELTGMVNS